MQTNELDVRLEVAERRDNRATTKLHFSCIVADEG